MSKEEQQWNDSQPIYRQITDRLILRIVDGTYPEGELLPSVRQVADDFGVSPLTAAKVFKLLDQEDLTIKRRGIGSEVRPGARSRLQASERKNFLEKEWPELRDRLRRLGIDVGELLATLDDD